MNANLKFIFIIFAFHFHLASSCVFSEKGRKIGVWDTKDYPRKLYKGNGGCDCGTYEDIGNDTKTYVVYVHSQTSSPDKNATICTGTILASNLVAVSHKCLQLDDRSIQVYDTWRPPPKFRVGLNLVDTKMVTICTNWDKTSGSEYKVRDIILNIRYALSTIHKKKATISDDLALLVTNDNLFEKGHNSVCLPMLASTKDHTSKAVDSMDVVHQLGDFYDVALESADMPFLEVLSDFKKLVIMQGSECDKDGGRSKLAAKDSLCVRHGTSLNLTVTGGPLFVTSAATGQENANFLVGIASEVNIGSGSSKFRYSYFSNILSLVKYIEKHAHKVGSEWCKAKDLKLGPRIKPTSAKAYPWMSLSKPSSRDKSLDCVCGIQNNLMPGTRISGGTVAEPYEYPWMVKLFIRFKYNSTYLDDFNCGGAVINDRLVVTAAHCVLNEKERVAAEVDVFISLHNAWEDPKMRVLRSGNVYYHPDYDILGQR